MEKDTQTQDNSMPGSAPTTGQIIPPHLQIIKQKKVFIPEITITDWMQGINIRYAKSPITKEAVAQILQWIETKIDRQFVYTIPESETSLLIILRGVHYTEKPLKEIVFTKETFEDAVKLVTEQLDKTKINDLKTIIVREVEENVLIVEKQRAELAQKFTYEDVSKIPPGVDPKQLDFLREAASVGAFEWVREHTAEMITKYFTSEITQIGLGKEYRITKQAVQERITRGLGKMRRILYKDKPELAEEDKYPLEQIRKGKDETEIFKSERHKEIRSQASGLRKPGKEVRIKPDAEKIEETWH